MCVIGLTWEALVGDGKGGSDVDAEFMYEVLKSMF